MAHQITNIDQQWGIEMAWHGLTRVKPTLTLDDCFLSRWDVQRTPLYTVEQTKTPFSVLRCSETGRFIGPAFESSYFPVTNKRFLEIVKQSLAGTEHQIASLGSVCARGRIFVSVKLAKLETFHTANRKFESYLNFGTSHDQSCVFYVNTSNVCTVCNNTFSANLHSKGNALRVHVKHTKSADQRLENLPAILDAAIGVQAEFAAAMSAFEQRPVSAQQARITYTGFLAPKEVRKADDVSTRTRNQVSRLLELFQHGPGNRGRDASDLFSAVTEYYTHESSGEDKQRQFESSEFGSGLERKQRFFDLLQDPIDLKRVYERGLMLCN